MLEKLPMENLLNPTIYRQSYLGNGCKGPPTSMGSHTIGNLSFNCVRRSVLFRGRHVLVLVKYGRGNAFATAPSNSFFMLSLPFFYWFSLFSLLVSILCSYLQRLLFLLFFFNYNFSFSKFHFCSCFSFMFLPFFFFYSSFMWKKNTVFYHRQDNIAKILWALFLPGPFYHFNYSFTRHFIPICYVLYLMIWGKQLAATKISNMKFWDLPDEEKSERLDLNSLMETNLFVKWK